MADNKDIKLVKCPNCGSAFYLKTKTKGELQLKCPYCEQLVKIKVNGDTQHDTV